MNRPQPGNDMQVRLLCLWDQICDLANITDSQREASRQILFSTFELWFDDSNDTLNKKTEKCNELAETYERIIRQLSSNSSKSDTTS